MKIAIPIFGPRVSPRFDFAPGLLLFTIEKGRIVERTEIDLTHLDPAQRLERLHELGIQALICGGIDGHSAQVLRGGHIQVTSWVAGEAETAMEYYLRGELKSGSNLSPWRGGNRHHRGRNPLCRKKQN